MWRLTKMFLIAATASAIITTMKPEQPISDWWYARTGYTLRPIRAAMDHATREVVETGLAAPLRFAGVMGGTPSNPEDIILVDDNTLYGMGRLIHREMYWLFKGDAMRRHHTSQLLAAAAGSTIALLVVGGLAFIVGLGPIGQAFAILAFAAANLYVRNFEKTTYLVG